MQKGYRTPKKPVYEADVELVHEINLCFAFDYILSLGSFERL